MVPLRVLLVHPEHGIFLGQHHGFTFWSRLDHGGLPAAATFYSAVEAAEFTRRFVDQSIVTALKTHPVTPDRDGYWASIAACQAAGLGGWSIPDRPGLEPAQTGQRPV